MDVDSLDDGSEAVVDNFGHVVPVCWVDLEHRVRVLLHRAVALRSRIRRGELVRVLRCRHLTAIRAPRLHQQVRRWPLARLVASALKLLLE